MGGSTIAQFLYEGYNQNLIQAVTQMANQLTAATTLIWQVVVSLWVLVIGKRLMFNQMTAGDGMSKMANLALVWLILSADNYTQWVLTPGTKTVPDYIASLVTGSSGLAGAQGFDALINQIDAFCALARAQTVSFFQIADRLTIFLIGASAKLIVGGCFTIWSLSMATADFLLPLGRIVLPFFLFDATRGFAERWYGKIFALFLVMIVALMLGQVIVFQDAQYMQRYANFLAADAADNTFSLGALASVGDGGLGPAIVMPTDGNLNRTINVDGAIDTLLGVAIVNTYGLFLLVIVSGIALFIGAAHGYSAAPAFNAVATLVRAGLRRGW